MGNNNFVVESIDGAQFLLDYNEMVAYEIYTEDGLVKLEKLSKYDYNNLIEQLAIN